MKSNRCTQTLFSILHLALLFPGLTLAVTPQLASFWTTPDSQWESQNPSEGAIYNMSRFHDGIVIAIQQKPAVAQRIPPSGGGVYTLWKQNKISCTSRRTTSDMLGHNFNVCQANPFVYQEITAPTSGNSGPRDGDRSDHVRVRDTTSRSQNGEVWIMKPVKTKQPTLAQPAKKRFPSKDKLVR